ncbi:MAG: phosphoglycerate dehydrogenase [Bacillota bacterium]|nr:phosphoglycerate dehydrogenase [Bacillota bacterium]
MTAFKVVVTARSFGEGSEEPLALLHQAGCEVVRSGLDRPLSAQELAGLIKGADALITGNDRVDASVIAGAARLKVISRYGVGLDNIDLQAAAERGIVVTNTPGANDQSVADLVMTFVLACARRLMDAAGQVRSGRWQRVLGSEVWRKTLGIIGTGRIGRCVAQRARGFQMRILCFDAVPDPGWADANEATYTSFDALLAASDFVTLHVPLNKQTRGLIGARELRLMKPSAYLINTARGGIVDEQALHEALISGTIAGAALDVLEHEPAMDSPLCGLPNVLITAHTGGYTREAVRRMSMMAAQNTIDVLTRTTGETGKKGGCQ